MDRRPIGIFDSGLGGLCAVSELRTLLAGENIVYFGDTGRVPYGTKSPETIRKYAAQDVRFLLSRGVKAILAACGTVSSVALGYLQEAFSSPLFGVAEDAVAAALQSSVTKRIAVIGTEATVSSGFFEKKLREGGAETFGAACQLFVSLVECGFVEKDDPLLKLACEKYLAPVKDFGADTVILGCTHFPIISGAVSAYLPGVSLINPSKEAAKHLAHKLSEDNMLSDTVTGKTEYYVSDEPLRFEAVSRIFAGSDISAEKIDIEKF